MQKVYFIVRDKLGRPLSGATVDVHETGTTTDVNLYEDDETTPIGNPITTTASGIVEFNCANDDIDIDVTKNGVTTSIDKLVVFDNNDITIGDLVSTNNLSDVASATTSFDNISPLTTQGDILYHNGTNNVSLAKGTASQVLAMNSLATAPEWVDATSGGKVLGSNFNSSSASGTPSTSYVTLRTLSYTPQSTNSTIYVAAGGMWYLNGCDMQTRITVNGATTGLTSNVTGNNTGQMATTANNGFPQTILGAYTNTTTTAKTFDFDIKKGAAGSATPYGGSYLQVIEVEN